MTTSTPPAGTLRLACRHFGVDDVAALRRLLALLEPHLKRRWVLVGGDTGDFVLVNLDAAGAHLPAGARNMAGCASKPRNWPDGTLYRPLRPAGVLAALSAYAEGVPSNEKAVVDAVGNPQLRYRLRGWPLRFSQWPRPWWAVLAAINHVSLSVSDIATQVGLDEDEVRRCLAEVEREALLECQADPVGRSNIAHSAQRSWRDLVVRVGVRLGFGR